MNLSGLLIGTENPQPAVHDLAVEVLVAVIVTP